MDRTQDDASSAEPTVDGRNVGRLDAIVRALIGLGMLSMIYFVPESGYWGLLGLWPIWTALSRRCAFYTLFGWRTGPGWL